MELLDRYLKEVALWLPHKQAADIVAEVRADIQSEMDDRRESLGRALTPDEQEAILTRWGHPMLVASRYQTNEPFIGPALLPTYYFVLKVVGLVYVLPWFVAWLAFAVFEPGWVDTRGLTPSLQPLVLQALVLFAIITVGFAMLTRSQRRERTLETWAAGELVAGRKKRDWREKSRSSALLDLVINAAVLSWWAGIASAPSSLRLEPAVFVTVPSANALVYWPVLVLLLTSIAMALADLLHPRWTARRLGLQIAMDFTAVLVGAVLISYTVLQVVPGADTDLAKSATLVHWVNLSWKATVAIVIAALAGRIAINIRRLGSINGAAPAVAMLALAVFAIIAG